MIAFLPLVAMSFVMPAPSTRSILPRSTAIGMFQDGQTNPPVAEVAAAPSWQVMESGIKFQDKSLGAGLPAEEGTVVKVMYTVSFQSGQVLGTNRKPSRPLTFLLGKHDVPIFSEAVNGMRTGGFRRLVVPSSMIPPSQIQRVPKDQEGEPLVFEVELVGIETGAGALVSSVLPPGNRRVTLVRGLWALSFLPYL